MLADIKSKKILYMLFSYIKNRNKLNIIKYNRSLLNRLNITKDDFKSYIFLKELNEKLNLNIKDIDIEELNLDKQYIENEGLKYLNKRIFKSLKKLLLNNNYISNINELINFKFEKLEILNLSNNNISDIKILEKVNFKELKELILNDNDISEIKSLENVKFEKLKVLILEEVKFLILIIRKSEF